MNYLSLIGRNKELFRSDLIHHDRNLRQIISASRFLVIGGAGLIGSHIVDELLNEDVAEIIIYDNFTRGTHANLSHSLQDSRVKIFELGGDILHTDILDIVLIMSFITLSDDPTAIEFEASDINQDDNLDVLDIVTIVNVILSEE